MRLQFRLRTLFIVTAVAAVGCWFVDALYWAPFRTRQAPIASPDGSLVLWTSIGQGEGDPSDDGCVILEIRDKQQNLLFRTSSHASA